MNAEDKLANKLGLEVQTERIGKHTIHYVSAGTGHPILLLHGANIGWGAWYRNINELANDFKVFAIDLPGSGRSPALNYRKLSIKNDYVDVVRRFLDQRKLQKVHVIGHSFGGVIALRLALKHPELVNKIILVNPLGFTRHIPLKQKVVGVYPLAKLVSRTALKPTRKNMAKFLESALHNKQLDSEFIDYYHAAVSRHRHSHPLLFMNSLVRWHRMVPDIDVRKELSNITEPVMVILGKNDPMVQAKPIMAGVRKLPDHQLEAFEQTGHVPPLENSQRFNRVVKSFLTSNSSG